MRFRYAPLVLAMLVVACAAPEVRAQAATNEGAPATPATVGSPEPEVAAADVADEPTAPSRFVRPRWRDLRVQRPIGFDYARFSLPGGLGIGARYTGVPGASIDVALTSLLVTTEMQIGLSVYPVTIFRPSRVTPVLRFAARRLHFAGSADVVLDLLGVDFQPNDPVQFHVEGTTMFGVSAELGLDVVSRRGTHFEILVGRVYQVGGSSGRTPADGIWIEGLRLPTFGFTVGRSLAIGRIGS